jgi:hypothetical protein
VGVIIEGGYFDRSGDWFSERGRCLRKGMRGGPKRWKEIATWPLFLWARLLVKSRLALGEARPSMFKVDTKRSGGNHSAGPVSISSCTLGTSTGVLCSKTTLSESSDSSSCSSDVLRSGSMEMTTSSGSGGATGTSGGIGVDSFEISKSSGEAKD